MNKYEIVVVGVSAGGLEALSLIVPSLPADFSLAMIVVQHMHKKSDNFLSNYINSNSALRVKEAMDKEPILPGTVYIAPANYHLLIEEDKTLSLSTESRINWSRPSIDLLFESAADVYDEKLIGLILTGANEDGSNGLKKIKDFGGLTIVQDPEAALSDFMPRAAIRATKPDHVLKLEEISPFLSNINKSTTRLDA
jgi:two-component system, chemotaxis family, protein-glutamate methylesterase/glutaminase